MRPHKTKTHKIDPQYKREIGNSRKFSEEKTFSTGDVVEVIVHGGNDSSEKHHVGIVLDPDVYFGDTPNIVVLQGTGTEQYHPLWVYHI